MLGLTRADEPVKRALAYMRDCLLGRRQPPDGREKVINWDAFEAHMLAAWIRIFEPDDPLALPVARRWAELITLSFASGGFDADTYACAYRKRIPPLHPREQLIRVPQLYMVHLLKGLLDEATEKRFVDYLIRHEQGIYYVYGQRINVCPAEFASKKTSAYLAALETLAGYTCAAEKLRFAVDWIHRHQDNDGSWDLGASAKDGVYFPLSDSWRKPEDRRRDCSVRIGKLLAALA